jgi:hypothetical protein
MAGKTSKKQPLVIKEWLGYTHAVDEDNNSLVRVGSTDPHNLGVRVLKAMVAETNIYFLGIERKKAEKLAKIEPIKL